MNMCVCLVFQTNLFSKYMYQLHWLVLVSLFTIHVNIIYIEICSTILLVLTNIPVLWLTGDLWCDSSSYEKWSRLHYFPPVGGVWRISDTFHLHLTVMIWSKSLQASFHLERYIWFRWGSVSRSEGTFLSSKK